MKNKTKFLALLLTMFTCALIFPKHSSAQNNYVSTQIFYDELSPYGEWVDYPNYGYVWLPYVGPEFIPYSTQGQWIMTEYGWTWLSNYEWGWAPFHYGRWDFDNYYGWFWVPDNEWGPSWVTWRRADGYYGWQPMRPGISVSLSFGNDYNRYNDRWIFVRDRDFERSNLSHYYVDKNQRERIFINSSVINNTYNDRSRNTTYVSGPDRNDVQRVTGRKVKSVTIQENNRPGQKMSNGRLQIYRPEVRNSNDRGQKPAPSRVSDLKEVKRPSERNATNQQRNVKPATNNRREQQQKTVAPQNRSNNVQPAQQRNVRPNTNIKQERQQKTVSPQNNKRQVQPTQQRQPQTVTPQNTNRQVQPTQQRNVKPANNRKQQKQAVTPQESNSNKQTKESKSKEKKGKRR